MKCTTAPLFMHEKELIEKSRTGDEEAYRTLVERYRMKIFYLCLSITKDEKTAEDLTQETFLHAYTHLSSFREESTFYTWTYRIATNLALNYLKKKKRHQEEFYQEGVIASHSKDIGDNHLEEVINKGLSLLDEKHRIVFELYEMKKMAQKEIGALLDIPPGTVRSRLYYARKKMKEFLKEEGL